MKPHWLIEKEYEELGDMQFRGRFPGDPIFKSKNKYYFWDETWSNCFGPFETQELVDESLKKYAETL